MPIVILVAGIFIIGASSRRMLTLSAKPRRSWRKWTERILLSIMILVATAIAGCTGFNAIAVYRFWSSNPPPGRLVDVDGYKMHIN